MPRLKPSPRAYSARLTRTGALVPEMRRLLRSCAA